MAEVIWRPSPDRVGGTQLRRFAEHVRTTYGLESADYAEVHRWSVRHPEQFWSELWDWLEVVGERGDRPLAEGDDFAATRFLPEARLNFAENLLWPTGGGEAIVAVAESGGRRSVSWDQLRSSVARVARSLEAEGVGPGDRVAAWLPNIIETVVLMLGSAAVGAVFSSGSPDFGVAGIVDRFSQISPKVLVGVDGYTYNGRVIPRAEELTEVASRLEGAPRVVVVPYLRQLGLGSGAAADDTSARAGGAIGWEDWLAEQDRDPVPFERFPFDHPLYILFSSGTTGVPKCMVHRAGGILLQHLKEHRLHCDIRRGDRVFYFTTAGWMMWNWLASVLGSGATAVLYDGSPFHPGPRRLFDLAEEERVTLFGISAKYLEAVAKAGVAPMESHDLTHLRTICSTGSPLVAEGYRYVYGRVKQDVHLASISGGTDICGCFVGGVPTEPVREGEIQGPILGMATEVWNEQGEPAEIGQRGELVCTRPFPSVPLRFENDPQGERFRRSYFERFPGVWAQGDFAVRTESGGFEILGRSDATLNPGGVRIGTAEIYRQVDSMVEVAESVVVGHEIGAGDTEVVLFVRTAEGVELDRDLESVIRDRIRTGASPRHVPARIIAVDDIPRTRSGKLAELAVREVIHGRPVENTAALANPEALEYFVNRLGDSP